MKLTSLGVTSITVGLEALLLVATFFTEATIARSALLIAMGLAVFGAVGVFILKPEKISVVEADALEVEETPEVRAIKTALALCMIPVFFIGWIALLSWALELLGYMRRRNGLFPMCESTRHRVFACLVQPFSECNLGTPPPFIGGRAFS
jgi:hypothetical protein